MPARVSEASRMRTRSMTKKKTNEATSPPPPKINECHGLAIACAVIMIMIGCSTNVIALEVLISVGNAVTFGLFWKQGVNVYLLCTFFPVQFTFYYPNTPGKQLLWCSHYHLSSWKGLLALLRRYRNYGTHIFAFLWDDLTNLPFTVLFQPS